MAELTLSSRDPISRHVLLMSWIVGLLGATFYAWLLALSTNASPDAFGHEIYDQLWLALLDGRLDLPARVLRLEGHYAPDGTGYLYHGFAPLLTRAVFDPFVTLGTGSLAPLSIWLWAVTGSGFWHAAFLGALDDGRGWHQHRPLFTMLVGVFVWAGGPGTILAANHSFYIEPIAVAYAACAIFAFIWLKAVQAQGISGKGLMCLALVAALCVHARPHLALGLYGGTGLMAGWFLVQRGWRGIPSVGVVVGLLVASGLAYLVLNELRFGEFAKGHGSFSSGGAQYGTTFWGLEAATSARAQTFEEHGRFDVRRILPNLPLYIFAPPQYYAAEAHRFVHRLYLSITEPWLGYLRVERPDVGLLFLWSFWSVAAAAGIGLLRRAGAGMIALVTVMAVGAGLMLSYPTITLRYRVDIWPLLAALALVGLPRLGQEGRSFQLLVAVGLFGMMITVQTAALYRTFAREYPSSGFAAWDEETCRKYSLAKGFSVGRTSEICREPLSENET